MFYNYNIQQHFTKFINMDEIKNYISFYLVFTLIFQKQHVLKDTEYFLQSSTFNYYRLRKAWKSEAKVNNWYLKGFCSFYHRWFMFQYLCRILYLVVSERVINTSKFLNISNYSIFIVKRMENNMLIIKYLSFIYKVFLHQIILLDFLKTKN